ncbi:hypothetical protein [Sphingobium boeckii]|uniref:hypothetical protein n=1 Tax=Sphingobium boeckii TaxID=1082345 RepID=UPI0016105704|nr:hypothetical protein [Sphingobium boeckii]
MLRRNVPSPQSCHTIAFIASAIARFKVATKRNNLMSTTSQDMSDGAGAIVRLGVMKMKTFEAVTSIVLLLATQALALSTVLIV